MTPIHPGRILKRELQARDLSANRLALAIRVPSGLITDILNGKRGISAETALRLARFFGASAAFWMNCRHATIWRWPSVIFAGPLRQKSGGHLIANPR